MAVILKPKEQEVLRLDDGVYDAELMSVTKFENSFGPRIGFEFELSSGERIMKSTAPTLSPKSQLLQVVQALMGRSLMESEIAQGVDGESLVGTRCRLLIAKAQSRAGVWFPAVEKILPSKHQQ